MTELVVVCEGQTEAAFVRQVRIHTGGAAAAQSG